MSEFKRSCELCAGQADFYCPSDSAFLCVTCDKKVHSANFLVARHVRVTLRSPSPLPAGNMILFPRGSCAPLVVEVEDDCLSSSSSSCVSSTGEASSSTSSMRRKTIDPPSSTSARAEVDAKVEAVLLNWCRKMDMCDDDTNLVVKTGLEVLTGCVGKMTVLPFRVLLAAALWAAIRVCKKSADVARVEQISGVPAKLILSTESRVARVIKRSSRPREDHVEGWAEC